VLLEKGPAYFFDAVVFPTYALRDAIYAGPRAEVLVNLLPKRALQQDIDPDQKRDHDLVFVGSMSPFRAGPAMEMMVHILAERPNARMLFIGLPEATVSWMLTHCPSDAVRSAMTFHPRVPHLEVSRVITRARIGFDYHPMERRLQEAIPKKVYEYMDVCLPVVSSRFPELERQFRANEEIIFVDGDDQRNYARAVLDLITDSDRRARLAAAGRKRLESGLNWEDSEAPKLITLYNRLLKQGH
jgi:glycosyltransferase involved in cell wall biosynthesis